jgi:hypothetical protein
VAAQLTVAAPHLFCWPTYKYKALHLTLIDCHRYIHIHTHLDTPPSKGHAQIRHAKLFCNIEEQEGHHEGEETSGFGEGETQDGVLEELATEGRVAGDTLDQTAEDSTDTNTSTSETDGGDTSALDLGSSDHSGGSRLSDDAAGLDDVAADVVRELVAHGAKDEAVL